MKEFNKYQTLFALKQLILIAAIYTMVVQPVYIAFAPFSEGNYELVDLLEGSDEDSDTEETEEDGKKEKVELQISRPNSQFIAFTRNSSDIDNQNLLQDPNLEIPIPPPES
ncbi:hypothetical protein GWK08_17970 [Leptobacterium flavescens]|uniref:Uncharacterized protein n=1 Tax=Leptobacterium flavescens TaxID=472055 RepID=A0A6P0UR37_9FLAO|nr:hypothetical protein [Leptobacterium flavescens]NER15347.1 hypothetical protein [Leptobacterium flavescens]